jgi:prepilin-type N-terminal cleavage/methylation domain-containing protein
MKRFTKGHKGFTLIELLIVIIIIAILAAIAIPMFLNQRAKAKDSSVKEAVHTVLVGIQSYSTDNNDLYPADGAGDLNAALTDAPAQIDQWPTDPFAAPNTEMPVIATGGTMANGTLEYDNKTTDFYLAGGTNANSPFVGHGTAP